MPDQRIDIEFGFPKRVWYVSQTLEDGTRLWASRQVEPTDIARRMNFIADIKKHKEKEPEQ